MLNNGFSSQPFRSLIVDFLGLTLECRVNEGNFHILICLSTFITVRLSFQGKGKDQLHTKLIMAGKDESPVGTTDYITTKACVDNWHSYNVINGSHMASKAASTYHENT